jgi:hypothetical protein
MTAAIGIVLAGGAAQLWSAALEIAPLAALACAFLVIAVLLWRTRARRRPHGEIGDDALAMIRRAREEDRAEAEADFEREVDEMVKRWGHG